MYYSFLPPLIISTVMVYSNSSSVPLGSSCIQRSTLNFDYCYYRDVCTPIGKISWCNRGHYRASRIGQCGDWRPKSKGISNLKRIWRNYCRSNRTYEIIKSAVYYYKKITTTELPSKLVRSWCRRSSRCTTKDRGIGRYQSDKQTLHIDRRRYQRRRNFPSRD